MGLFDKLKGKKESVDWSDAFNTAFQFYVKSNGSPFGAINRICRIRSFRSGNDSLPTYRKAEAVVEQYNRDLAAWERPEKKKLAQKEQAKPLEWENVRKRLRQL